jgi:septal ring factor EnvC (AmiA/AmiB activator)
MKLLPNLLLVLALALCGLCAYQWVREGQVYQELGSVNDELYKKREAIQGLEQTIKRNQSDITRLEGIRTELKETIRTNTARIAELDKYVQKLENETDNQRTTIGKYKEALDTANERIQKQNDDIQKQNDAIKLLVQQRDEKVADLNKLIGEYNSLVTNFNRLQEDMNKLVETINAEQQKKAAEQQKKPK